MGGGGAVTLDFELFELKFMESKEMEKQRQ